MGQVGRDFSFQSFISPFRLARKYFPFGKTKLDSVLLRVVIVGASLLALLRSTLKNTPYSVREWCRFLTELSRLLSKTDCFELVTSGTLLYPPIPLQRGVNSQLWLCENRRPSAVDLLFVLDWSFRALKRLVGPGGADSLGDFVL